MNTRAIGSGWPHAHRRGSRACADHRLQVGTTGILRSIRLVDPIVDRSVDWLEDDVLCHTAPREYGRLSDVSPLDTIAIATRCSRARTARRQRRLTRSTTAYRG